MKEHCEIKESNICYALKQFLFWKLDPQYGNARDGETLECGVQWEINRSLGTPPLEGINTAPQNELVIAKMGCFKRVRPTFLGSLALSVTI